MQCPVITKILLMLQKSYKVPNFFSMPKASIILLNCVIQTGDGSENLQTLESLIGHDSPTVARISIQAVGLLKLQFSHPPAGAQIKKSSNLIRLMGKFPDLYQYSWY